MTDPDQTEPVAWVSDRAERLLVEEGLQQLVGRRIERVRYAELAYSDPPEPVWPGPGFDSLDFGLELDLDDGATWSVTWEQADEDNRGILAFPGWHGNLQPEYNAVWDVTAHWRAHGPQDIAAVAPIWVRETYPDQSDRWARKHVSWVSDLCLFTLILTAPDAREAVITLGQRSDDGRLEDSVDNLAVFFSRDAARGAGVVLEGEPTGSG